MLDIFLTVSNFVTLLVLGLIYAVVYLYTSHSRALQRKQDAVLRRQSRAQQERLRATERVAAVEIAALREACALPRSLTEQQETLGACTYIARPLLDSTRLQLLQMLDAEYANAGQPIRTLARIPLIEFLNPAALRAEDTARRAGFEALARLRTDYAMVDAGGQVVCALDYIDTQEPDALKEQVLFAAGIPFVTITPHDPWEAIVDKINAALMACDLKAAA